jgi:glycosyltransferase involved in cell wall biosynthesis
VGVLTSESEGLSNSLLEYGAMGVPTVTFDTGGNAEVVVEGETGFLVPEGDVEALADRVAEVLGDEGLRIRLGEAARRRCREVFDPEPVMKSTLAFLEGVARSPRRAYHAR